MAGRNSLAAGGLRVVLCALGVCSFGAGQTAELYRYNGNGYVTFGIGRCQHQVTNISVGVGGEGFLWRGLTLGGDAGYYRFVQRGSYQFGITALNVGYNFAQRKRRNEFEPFVNAGVVGVAFGPGVTQSGSVGGGVNMWVKPKLGVRMEGRVTGFGGEALAMFRVGLVFR